MGMGVTDASSGDVCLEQRVATRRRHAVEWSRWWWWWGGGAGHVLLHVKREGALLLCIPSTGVCARVFASTSYRKLRANK